MKFIARASQEAEDLKKDWTANNAVLLLIGAFLMGKIWEPARGTYTLFFVVTIPNTSSYVVLSLAMLFFLLSIILAIATYSASVRRRMLQERKFLSPLLDLLVWVSFTLSWAGAFSELPLDRWWAMLFLTVGMLYSLVLTDAIIRVPTLARQVLFRAGAFSGPIVLPSSHAILQTSLTGAEAEEDTVADAWLPPTNLEELSEQRQRNYGPTPTRLLPAFSPGLHLGILPDGGLAFSDSSAYAVKIVEPGRGIVRILSRPLHPRPMSGRVIRAERDRRLRLLEETAIPGVDVNLNRTRIENLEFAAEIPVVRGLGTTWDGRIWVLRYAGDLLADGPIDVLTADGRYLGSYRTELTGLPTAFGPDGLVAHVETSDLGVQTVTVKRVVAR